MDWLLLSIRGFGLLRWVVGLALTPPFPGEREFRLLRFLGNKMATNAVHLYKTSAARVLVLDGFVPGPRGAPALTPALPAWPAKDPADVLDYQFDITPALSGNDGDAVATLDVTISPANSGDLSMASAAADGARAVLWLAGGQAGTTYSVTLTIGTQAGRTLSRSVLLPVLALTSTPLVAGALLTDTGSQLVDESGNPLLLGN